MRIKTVKLNKLAFYVVGTELVGFLGFLLGGNPKNSYNRLVKPPFAPPGWLFSVAWILLYACMGLAAYFFSKSGRSAAGVLKIYAWQLFLNALWSPVFWRLDFKTLAAFMIAALLILNGMILCKGTKLSKIGAFLFVPYFLWLFFAFYLNIGFVLLN